MAITEQDKHKSFEVGAFARLANIMALAVVVLMLALALIGGYATSLLQTTPADVLAKVTEIEGQFADLLEELTHTTGESQIMADALQESGAAVAALDPDGIIQMWSAGAEKLFGVPESDALGLGSGFLIPNGMRAKYHLSFEKKMKDVDSSSYHRFEGVALHSDGSEIPIVIEVWPVPGQTSVAIFTPREMLRSTGGE